MIHCCLKKPELSPGGELSYGREGEGGTRWGLEIRQRRAPVTCSILALLVSGQKAINVLPPPFLLQPSVGLSASFSLSRLEFLGVRLGQRSCGNRFPSPGTPPCAQAAPLCREVLGEELSPGIPRPPVCLEIGVWGAAP